MLRSTSLRVLRPEDLPAVTDAARPRPGRRRVRGLPGARPSGSTRPARRRDVGLRRRRPPRVALLRRRQPGARCRPAPRRSRAFAERARRQGRRCSSIVGPRDAVAPHVGPSSSRPGGRPARSATRPAADGDRRSAVAGAGRPAGAAGPAGRDRRAAAGLRGDVHRGGRRLAARRRRRGVLPQPGRRAGRAPAGPSPGSRTAGSSSRPRSARSAGRLPGAGRVGAARAARPRARRAGDGGGRRAALREVAPVVSLYVNDFNHAARATYRRVGFADVGTVHVRPVLDAPDRHGPDDRREGAACSHGCGRTTPISFFRVLYRASPRLASAGGCCSSCAARCRRCWPCRPVSSSARSRRVVADRSADLRRRRLRARCRCSRRCSRRSAPNLGATTADWLHDRLMVAP